MMRHGPEKAKLNCKKVLEYMNIVTWYINKLSCLCPGGSKAASVENCSCSGKRGKLQRTAGADIYHYAMTSLFRVVQDTEALGLEGSNGRIEAERTDGGESTEEESDEGCHASESMKTRSGKKRVDFGSRDGWVRILYGGFHNLDEHLDATIELAGFLLSGSTEPWIPSVTSGSWTERGCEFHEPLCGIQYCTG